MKFTLSLLFGLIAVVLLSLSPSTQAQTTPNAPMSQVQTVLPDDLQWKANPDIAGAQSAIALGEPSNSELYVLFGKMNAGATFPAHTHPDARITTVISGVMYYGSGERIESANLQPYSAGAVVYTPADVPHFMWAKDGEAVMQETGFGPTGLEFTADVE